MMDALLEDMVRSARDQLRKHFGDDLWDAQIDWDNPRELVGKDEIMTEEELCTAHAIGFIAGVAAAADLTPLMLLAEIRDINDPAVAREIKVALAHHDGRVIEVTPEDRRTVVAQGERREIRALTMPKVPRKNTAPEKKRQRIRKVR
jgi:hypothetical protein